MTVDFAREVEIEEQQISIELRSRGYLYELTPPVPVEVLEGNILGRLQEPIVSFRNVRYPEEEAAAEGDAGAATSPPADGGVAPAPTTE